MRPQLFAKENRQDWREGQRGKRRKEKQNVRMTERRDREWDPWEQKYSCQFPVADRQQC